MRVGLVKLIGDQQQLRCLRLFVQVALQVRPRDYRYVSPLGLEVAQADGVIRVEADFEALHEALRVCVEVGEAVVVPGYT